jgi:RecA/RadA recombinase
MSAASDAKKALTQKSAPPSAPGALLSTGSALLNLALSGDARGGIAKGKYYLWVGDSQAGKSWVGLTTLAEAHLNKHFDGYDLIHANVEDGALMDKGRYFGEGFAKRLKESRPQTVEEFYYELDDLHAAGRKFVYLLDSMDSLTSEADEEQFQKVKKAHQAGREASGSYGTAKPKQNSAGLRSVVNKLSESGSVLIVIAQTRDNIGFGSQFNPKTRGGGRALKFYATNELWFSIKEKITRKAKGFADKPRHVGNWLKVQVKKNRQTGWEPVVELPIYHGSGLDDVGACVNYLIEEKHWEGNDTRVKAPEFSFDGKIEDLIRKIESENAEKELHASATSVWRAVEAACRVDRKQRYQ